MVLIKLVPFRCILLEEKRWTDVKNKHINNNDPGNNRDTRRPRVGMQNGAATLKHGLPVSGNFLSN